MYYDTSMTLLNFFIINFVYTFTVNVNKVS